MKVVAGIVEKDGKLLLFFNEKHKKWEFPGGKVEEGETDVEALKREWREELDCEILVEKWFDDYYNDLDGYEISYYLISIIGDYKLKEHTEAKYHTPNDALEIVTWVGDWIMIGEFYE